MRITQWGEYGVLFATFVARRLRDGAPMVTAAEVAKARNVELQYAQQIIQRLRKGGVIDSVRGPGGGYLLCRPASEITLFDILTATEGESFEVICESKPIHAEHCVSGTECGLRGLWFDLREHLNVFLKQRTLEQLTNMPSLVFTDGSLHSGEAAPIKIGG